MINPILKSSIKDTLFDPYDTDSYGIMHRMAKQDCLDTGNKSEAMPYPYTSLEKKVDNAFELISNRRSQSI